MALAQLLRIQKSIIVTIQLLLLLLPLPLLLQASPCPIVEEIMNVTTTSEADSLAEALLCAGSGQFAVTWHGDVILSRTISVSNGSTLNVKGSSENTDDVDTGAVVIGDGTNLMFKVDHGSNVSLTGLTFSGGNGTLSVTGESSIEVIDCTFVGNNRTSSSEEPSEGGAIYVDDSSLVLKGDVVFANNTADYGGVISVNSSSIVLKGETVFANNTADYGGAILLWSSELQVTEGGSVSFFNNHASLGGAVLIAFDSNALFGGETVFAGNTARDGGAVLIVSDSNALFGGETVFANNTAAESGGAVYIDDSNALFGGETVFANNTAELGVMALEWPWS